MYNLILFLGAAGMAAAAVFTAFVIPATIEYIAGGMKKWHM